MDEDAGPPRGAQQPGILLRAGDSGPDRRIELPTRWIAEAPDLGTLFPATVVHARESWSRRSGEPSHCYEAGIDGQLYEATVTRAKEMGPRAGLRLSNWSGLFIQMTSATIKLSAERSRPDSERFVLKVCASQSPSSDPLLAFMHGIPILRPVWGLPRAIGRDLLDVSYERGGGSSQSADLSLPIDRERLARAAKWLAGAGFERRAGGDWGWDRDPWMVSTMRSNFLEQPLLVVLAIR